MTTGRQTLFVFPLLIVCSYAQSSDEAKIVDSFRALVQHHAGTYKDGRVYINVNEHGFVKLVFKVDPIVKTIFGPQ